MTTSRIIYPMAALLVLCSVCLAKDKPVNPLEGKPPATLAGILKENPDEAMRYNAAKALDSLVPEKKASSKRPPKEVPSYDSPDDAVVKALIPGLSDKASGVRHACRVALGRCGGVAIGDLVAVVANSTGDTRASAANALGDMGAYDDAVNQPLADAVPALTKILSDKDYTVRVSGAMALSRIGVHAAPALPQLLPLLDDEEWAVADAAVRAVAAADPSGKHSVPALAKVLKNKKHDLREFVCMELAAMGAKAEPAIPALIVLLDTDRDGWQAGKAAAEALAAIISVDPKQPELPVVSEATRKKVIAVIAKNAAIQKYPLTQNVRLFALLPNVQTNVNRYCYKGELGVEALPALPLAIERMKQWSLNPSPWVPMRGAYEFVGIVGVHAKDDVIPVVKELLANKDLDPTRSRKPLEELLKKLED